MNFQKVIFLAIISLSLLATSCKNETSLKEDAIVNIPANSSSVSAINVKRLMDKADFESMQKMSFYQDFIKDASQGNPGVEAVLKDPYASGVNLDGNIYLVQDVDIMNPEKGFMGIVASLSDKAAFKKLLASDGNAKFQSAEGFEYLEADRKTIVAMNDDIVVMGLSRGNGTDLKTGVEGIFNTTKETSIVSNEDLQKCFSKKADITSWFSSNKMAEAAKGKMGMAGFIISPTMLTENYAHSYFNFEKGAIVSESNYDFNEKLSDEFRHVFKDQVKTDFSKYVPAEDLIFAFTGAIDMKGINMILTKKTMTGMADMTLKQYGLTTKDLANTIDGDFLITTHGKSYNDNPNMLMAIKINDMDGFQQIIDLGKDYEMIESLGDGLYQMSGLMGSADDMPMFYVTDGMLFVGDAKSTIPALQAGEYAKNGLVSKDIKNIFSKNIMGGFVNFSNIGNYLDGVGIDFNAMKDATMELNRDNGTMKINMTDKNKNALKSIIDWTNKNYEKKGAM
ncbi:MAG: DUF4836 family protein [Saprospiraceae bacterium]